MHRLQLRGFAVVVVVGVSCVAVSSCGVAGRQAAASSVVDRAVAVARVDARPAQRIVGFGASGAWWPNDLVRFPPKVQHEVARLLFSRDGIALSGYRYNIGGGGSGVTTPARAPQEYPSDGGGRLFLRFASISHVPVITGFVNSAPPRFTTNGKACGGSLKPGAEDAYAQYLVDIVRALREHDHVTLQYLSPMNEPDNSFGSCGQEGMAVPIAQRATVVRALGRELARFAPSTKVIADETTADVLLANEAPQWLSVPHTMQYLAAIAHHTYDFPNDALRRLLPPLAARFDRPTWMTEICCYKGSGGVASSFGPQYDPTITQGLWLADQIDADLSVAGDSAWYWWTALSPVLGCDPAADPTCPTRVNPNGFNDGLLYYDEHGTTDGITQIFTTKRFYVLGHFSRYVRPGAVRHEVTGLPAGVHAMAFADGDRWTVVTWNEGTSPATLGLELPDRTRRAAEAVTTDASRSLARTALPERTRAGTWTLQIPATTIATYTFQ